MIGGVGLDISGFFGGWAVWIIGGRFCWGVRGNFADYFWNSLSKQ